MVCIFLDTLETKLNSLVGTTFEFNNLTIANCTHKCLIFHPPYMLQEKHTGPISTLVLAASYSPYPHLTLERQPHDVSKLLTRLTNAKNMNFRKHCPTSFICPSRSLPVKKIVSLFLLYQQKLII